VRILLDDNLLSRKLKQLLIDVNSMSTRSDRLIPLIIKLIPLLSSLEAGTVTLIDEYSHFNR
jgi:hypothetical protein